MTSRAIRLAFIRVCARVCGALLASGCAASAGSSIPSGYGALTDQQLATVNPLFVCPWLHSHAAPNVVLAFKKRGLMRAGDAPMMRQGIVVPGMTECDMLVTLGQPADLRVSMHAGRPAKTQWIFRTPRLGDEEIVTEGGIVTAVRYSSLRRRGDASSETARFLISEL